jgi:hypothetical protein
VDFPRASPNPYAMSATRYCYGEVVTRGRAKNRSQNVRELLAWKITKVGALAARIETPCAGSLFPSLPPAGFQ